MNKTSPDHQPFDAMPLSVQGLTPNTQEESLTPKAVRAGRLQMLMVLLVCAAPVVASYFSYYVIKPKNRTNNGELILPPVAMPADQDLILRKQDGQTLPVSALKGQWLFVTVAGGQCDSQCEKKLYEQRQIREALGKEKDRVDRVWIIHDDQPMRATLAPAMQGAWVLQANKDQLKAWLSPQTGNELQDHWYLIDTRGQWMMRFAPKIQPRQVFKDISRLLRAAGAGDEAGRQ